MEHNAYNLRVSSDSDDVLATVMRSSPSPGQERGVSHDHITRTKMLTFASLRPIHQICLSGERLVMAKLRYLMDRGLKIRLDTLLSCRNGGACVQPGKCMKALKAIICPLTYGDMTRLRQRFEPLRVACVPTQHERQSDSTRPVFRFKE